MIAEEPKPELIFRISMFGITGQLISNDDELSERIKKISAEYSSNYNLRIEVNY